MKERIIKRSTNRNKFEKSIAWYGADMPIGGYRTTGVYGMYCNQVRHYWLGIKGLFGLRYTVKL